MAGDPDKSPQPEVRPTAYAVSCLPPEHPDAYMFMLHVEWRGPGDRWCVTNGAYCYSKTGCQRYEPNPSSRTDAFKRTYRHSLDDALALAIRLAPKITCGSHTVEWALSRGME